MKWKKKKRGFPKKRDEVMIEHEKNEGGKKVYGTLTG